MKANDSLFGNFSKNTDPVKVNICDSFTTVTLDDAEPVSLINPNEFKGPWIAGGAVLRWFSKRNVDKSDIDVFCKSQKQFDKIYQLITKADPSVRDNQISTDNATTLNYKKKWKIQLIKHTFFDSPQDVISRFDITVCQLATDGFKLWHGEDTFKDIKSKTLRMSNFKPDCVKRLIKYWIYGYKPVPGLMAEIEKHPGLLTTFENTGEYDNAF